LPEVSVDKSSQDQSEQNGDSERLAVLAKNLEIPWSMVFLPEGEVLFTERPGRVRIIDKDGKLNANPIATISAVKHIGEGGLLGIDLDPEFRDNRHVYLYYTYGESGGNTLNRVERYKFDGKSLRSDKVIVDGIPGASNHDGGRIKFGPDKFLYITTGDAQEPSRAQDTNSLAGKILRVTKDGQAAPGNPFNNRTYSYGHRNPQGITWDSQGRLFATEHGRSGAQSGLDELNLIEPGKNYGWPEIQGDETRDGMITATLNSGSLTWAPSGAVFFEGSIYFTGLRGVSLFEYDIESKKLTRHLNGELGRIRDVVVGPGKMLYITTNNRDGRGTPAADDDKILRVNPQKL
jgi:glucose/arabinose dehydrogenase